MDVAFRVDASRQVGMGHVRRCLSLARQLTRCGARIVFVSRDLGLADWLRAQIEGQGHRLVLIEPAASSDQWQENLPAPHAQWAEVGWQEDTAQFLAALDGDSPRWIVLDHYAFDSRWQEAVRAKTNARLVSIDDLADRPLVPDLLIDHNWHADHAVKYDALLPARCRLFAGPRYALLGENFARAERYRFSESVWSIGIFMGGSDAANASMIALQAVQTAGFCGRVEIIATSANPHLDDLRKACSQRAGTELSLDLPDLAGFFAHHDLQIGAGGGATWERFCIGAPSILVSFAENHDLVLLPLMAQGLARTLAGDWTEADLANAVGDLLADAPLRQRLHQEGMALVDGRGAERAALVMCRENLKLRPATERDCRDAFDWRNHPDTRSVSRQQDPLNWTAHRRWFESTLDATERSLYVAEIGQIQVGHIRLDRLGQEQFEVSFYLDPALHGLGLGTRLLAAVETVLKWGDMVIGEVLPGNAASSRLFDKLGYREVETGRWEKRMMVEI